MTTATKESKADQLAKLDQLEARVLEARQKRDEVQRDAEAAGAKFRQLEAELGGLAREHREQFADGVPKRDTDAAKVEAERKKLREGHWRDIIDGADAAVAEAERDVARFRAEHAEALATRGFRRGEALLDKLGVEAERVLGILGEVAQVEAELIATTAS